MKNLTSAICLTIAVLVGCGWVSDSAGSQIGLTPAQEEEAYQEEWIQSLPVQGEDIATTLRELTLLAEQGDATSQFKLGFMYRNGFRVLQDYETAIKWYTLAVEQKHSEAQFNLGLMYKTGEGVPQDYETAIKWYTLAAEQKHSEAQFNLGLMYAIGEGVPQDFETAIKWYTLAAEQKHSESQFNLGLMYANWDGVPQDHVYAHMWFNLAASSGDKIAPKVRDSLAEQMIPTQIAEAQKLARECVRKEYKAC
jgi:TPR repeat protein